MFDAKEVTPIANLIGLNREPTNEEMQAAAQVSLKMLCAVVNSLVVIAEELTPSHRGYGNYDKIADNLGKLADIAERR